MENIKVAPVAFGLGLGILIGFMMDNVIAGIGIGLAIAIAFNLAAGRADR